MCLFNSHISKIIWSLRFLDYIMLRNGERYATEKKEHPWRPHLAISCYVIRIMPFVCHHSHFFRIQLGWEIHTHWGIYRSRKCCLESCPEKCCCPYRSGVPHHFWRGVANPNLFPDAWWISPPPNLRVCALKAEFRVFLVFSILLSFDAFL